MYDFNRISPKNSIFVIAFAPKIAQRQQNRQQICTQIRH